MCIGREDEPIVLLQILDFHPTVDRSVKTVFPCEQAFKLLILQGNEKSLKGNAAEEMTRKKTVSGAPPWMKDLDSFCEMGTHAGHN